MTTTRIGAAIESAREAAGLSQRALQNRTGISQSTLSRILSGKRTAKMTEIIQIADATGCTVAQLTNTAITDRVQHAARATNGSTMDKMGQRLLHFIELDAYLDDQAIPTSLIDGLNMTPARDGKREAIAFRREHQLGNHPLGDLVALVERTMGPDVSVLDTGPDEHGLTMHDPVRGVSFVGIARTRNPMRQRSTLAHELAHVIFADWNETADLSVRSAEEIRADTFARHLLVPGEGLKEFLGPRESLSEADLSAVVQCFLVSPAIAAIALHDGGYIDAATKRAWMSLTTPRLATRFGWSDQYQSLQDDSDRTRSPQRLLTRATTGYAEGVVTAQTVATLRGISADAAAGELAEAGVTPATPSIPWMAAADLPTVTVDLSDLEDDPPEGSEE